MKIYIIAYLYISCIDIRWLSGAAILLYVMMSKICKETILLRVVLYLIVGVFSVFLDNALMVNISFAGTDSVDFSTNVRGGGSEGRDTSDGSSRSDPYDGMDSEGTEADLDDDADNDNDKEVQPGGFQSSIMAAINSAKNLDSYRNDLDIGKRLKQCGLFHSLQQLNNENVEGIAGKTKIKVSELVPITVEYDIKGKIAQLSFPIPEYTEGDLFIYSDGSWERVEKVFPDVIHWENHRGNKSSGRADFTYSRNKWQTMSRKGERVFSPAQFLFSKPSTTLWPLKVGNRNSFDEDGSWQGESGVPHPYDAYWRCEVLEGGRRTVAIGQFATMKIGCTRYSNAFSYPGSRGREYRVWDYAPELNHWIVESRHYFGIRADQQKELVAVMPDLTKLLRTEEETQEIQSIFQETLELKKDSSEPVVWRSSDLEVEISFWGKEEFVRMGDGIHCRRYELKVISSDLDKSYYGIACRNESEVWRVPRL